MPEAVIVAAARTPIGRAYKGALKDMRPDDLAAHAVRSALRQARRSLVPAQCRARSKPVYFPTYRRLQKSIETPDQQRCFPRRTFKTPRATLPDRNDAD